MAEFPLTRVCMLKRFTMRWPKNAFDMFYYGRVYAFEGDNMSGITYGQEEELSATVAE